MYQKYRILAVFLLMLFFVVGTISCAGVQLDTPEKRYLAARAELNLLLEQYISIQNLVDDETHEMAVQAFEVADMSLDTWEAMLGSSGYNPVDDVRTWLQAKSMILKILKEVSGG